MSGIDVALDALEPVAVHRDACGHHMVWRELVEDEIGKWGWLLRRTHVGPEHPGRLDDAISLSADLVFEIASRRVRRRSDALAVDVEGKAMVDAHEPALVIDPVVEGRAAMGAAFLEQ